MEEKKSVAEVTQQLREIEDYNLALRLQEEEFSSHYNRNREGRRLVGDDTKRSIVEQANEIETARRKRLEEIRKITETDEEIARRLQQEFEQEERRRREEVAQRDAELARRLAQNDGVSIPSSSTALHQENVSLENHQAQPPPLIDLSVDLSATNQTNTVPMQPYIVQPPLMGSVPGPPPHEHGWSVPPADVHDIATQGPSITLHPTNPFLQDLSPQPSSGSSASTQYYSEFGLPPPSDLALGKRN